MSTWERLTVKNARRKYYDQLLAEQNGVCAICGCLPTYRRLALDHCHETGKIRGLLCTRCNIALGHIEGWLKITNKSLTSFVDYLARPFPQIDLAIGKDLFRSNLAERQHKLIFDVKRLYPIVGWSRKKAI